jgi:hypothetical protein
MNKELEKAANEYSDNPQVRRGFIAGADWQAGNTIITDNSLVIDNLEKEIERLNLLLLK